MTFNEYISEKKVSIIVCIVLIILGSILYFTYTPENNMRLNAEKTNITNSDPAQDITIQNISEKVNVGVLA